MKNKFLHRALALFLSGAMLASVGCNDYDDDIENLNNRIDQVTTTVNDLKDLIESGSVITDVQKNGDGVVVTLSNNESFTLTNGTKGDDAAVWTIGADGYWYKDDVKQEQKAVGTDGNDGNDGSDGDDGENGQYYVPNPATGCFDIYKDGELVEPTEIKWTTASGITAVLKGNILMLSNVEGSEKPVEIVLGAQLGSVAFVPEVMSDEVAYPTTTDKFYHIANYITEAKFDVDHTFIPQTDWDKSNEVAMVYRLNPSNAYVTGAQAAFINRGVTTRAAFGDKRNLLNVVKESTVYGEAGDVTLKATFNSRNMSKKTDIAALQIWAGQNPVTSDYIHVESEAIEAVLANTKLTEAGSVAVEFYNRTKSIEGGQSDALVKEAAGKVGVNPAHFGFKYDGQIDLKPLVALYSNDVLDYLTEVGFTGIRYEFSKPEKYLADDDKKTNQQAYITLEDGVVKVSDEYNTSAIGRTPVVRVDAYMMSNAGTEAMVASAYIKLSIDRNDPTAPEKEATTIKIGENVDVDYREVGASFAIADMPWERISKELYDAEGLTSADFWNYYGGAQHTYNVKVVASGKNKTNTLIDMAAASNKVFDTKAEGVNVQVNLNSDAATTSYVKVFVDDAILTDHTYGEGGAKYTVEITIPSNDKKAHADFVLTQEFVVEDSCPMYAFNPLYHADKQSEYGQIAGVTNNDIIVVKGQLKNNAWEMSSVVSEHFAKKNGLSIFDYCDNDANVPNVTGISFLWAESPVEGVTPDTAQTADFTVALDGAMTDPYLVKAMTLTQKLANGEACDYDYDIVFVNPFVAGTARELTIKDAIGENKLDVKSEVRVNDTENDVIYSYVNGALMLSNKATGEYKVAADKVNVTYELDESNADYKEIMANKTEDSILEVNADGTFIWKNEGAKLMKSYDLTVIATVTFEDLSEVECKIPVTLAAAK